jgi:hypothetical protein
VSGPFAGDGGDLGDVEAGDHAEEDDLGLVAREGAAAPAVDGAVPGDGEDPGPEGALVAGEAGEAVHHPQPGL